MSVIEKLDSVLEILNHSDAGVDEMFDAAKELLRDHGPAIRQALLDSERWRYLKDERTDHYGDGHSEPNEAHLFLEWRQGPWIRDGSNGGRGRPDAFPGWDAIVDEMMANAASEIADFDDAAIDARLARATGEGEGHD